MPNRKTPAGPPSFIHESAYWSNSQPRVGGIDEAGRGPLAGGVVAAAVILDRNDFPALLNDSKKLNTATLERLFDEIMEKAVVSVGIVDHTTIDRVNIREATFLAMREAALGLSTPADAFLVDGNAIPKGLGRPATAIVSGDALSFSIAAASIIAKVTRDRMMRQLAVVYPQYGFDIHMGYPTKAHREAIRVHGPCPVHRMTFGPLKNLAA
jgi:ribonuclease HII